MKRPNPRATRPLPGGLPGGLIASLASLLALGACTTRPSPDAPPSATASPDEKAKILEASSLQKKLAAMTPSRPLAPPDGQKRLSAAIDQYFQRAATRRLYVHVDKPMYQPGETIWFRAWELATPTLANGTSTHGVSVELVSPKGAVVMQKRVMAQAGVTTNDFVLPDGVQGGEYTIRVHTDLGSAAERKVIVSSYQPPRIKKKLEFLRKAYGAGDTVAAALALSRATGEALARKSATAVVTVDEAEVARFAVQTDAAGNGVVRFDLPGHIARGDGLLTVLIEDGGVTESIQKRIPIVVKELGFEMFPEGGELIAELPGRVYFSAKNLIGKPADVEGRVVDDKGLQVAELRSHHNGMGRFEITPRAGAAYFVEITRPVGIAHKIPVPAAREAGCSMMAVDDARSERDDVRVAVWCSEPQTVIATAVLREKRLGDVAVEVGKSAPAVIAVPVPVGSQGAVRVTLMNEQLQPMAERLIYRGLGADLKVSISPDRATYAPRDAVELTVKTLDLAGKPVQADLSLAVVDDTVLSFADDKTAHMLARLYLESEMPGQEIEEPNFYFSGDAKAPQAIDLVLGTQGWRRFEWTQVLAPPPPQPTSTAGRYDFEDDMVAGALEVPMAEPEAAPMPAQPAPGRAARKPMARPAAMPARPAPPPADGIVANRAMGRAMGPMRDMRERREMAAGEWANERAKQAGGAVVADKDWDGKADRQMAGWAPVRVFPAPSYEGRYDGPRVDFRETIYWQPSVTTDSAGTAKVRFYLSDAVTSFRATAEGVSAGGVPGRGEALVQSKLPVSLDVKMPLEVSAGDIVKLPVTLTNETARPYEVAVSTQFGAAFRVQGGIPAKVSLKGGERKSFFAALHVVGNGKEFEDGKAIIAIDTSNLKDEMARTIKVVPLGFPQEISLAGTVDKVARHEVNLAGALPGTIEATVNLYPSPLATMVKGTEAIIREPTGCFEQASSANYPNIMVLGYLEENNAADPATVERAMGMLDRGYKKLTGYESPKYGYEWFGGDPGHEALTAYGLMEFADMARVYGDVDTGMIERTRRWLKTRRDGKGGYQRNSRALDSFGRASEQVTNGYVTYALSEAGEKDLGPEIAYQKEIAASTKDPYLMALAANVLVNIEPGSATTRSALTRLAAMQSQDGSFAGADHSITRSGGVALTIETTSLAALALIDAGQAGTPAVRNAIAWLNQNRSGFGGYGSTQSTILALKAMTAYASASRATESGGTVTLLVNGKQAGTLRFEQGHKDALVFDDVAAALRPGKNVIEVRLDSSIALPYSVALTYRSNMPASSKDSPVAVATRLMKSEVPMGEGVRMKATVKNITDQGIPMTLARIGLPGGLTFQTWQLKELKDKGAIDFYETGEREVVLYFRSMAPGAVKNIDLDLIATVPGQYVAPASRAYLYYTDEFKHWAEPVRVTVK